MPLTANTPYRLLVAVMLLNLALAATAVWLALSTPWLGLKLVGDSQGVSVLDARGPSAAVPQGVRLTTLAEASTGQPFALSAEDVMEEPDMVADYRQMDAFFERQERIAALLSAPAVRLAWPGGEAVVAPSQRPLTALPPVFWFQLAVAMAGCLIACWVWVLRPQDWGARMFGITGLMFPLFAMSAAVYSSRELALPGDLFFALSALNHLASFMFGAALMGIFLSHPRPLVKPVWLGVLFLVFFLWWLTDVLRIAPDLDWGNRFAVMTEMLLAMAFAVVQWRKSRGDPLDRAALRWFILSMLLGSGLFILSIVASASLGWLPPIPQGYAFGFFLLIYIGIALGLRRYRLFDLDEWAYRILLWVGGAAMVIGMDALLIAGLQLAPGPSLGITLIVCGWLYFPARQWLWQKVAHRPSLQLHELMPDVVDIAFQASREEREARWDSLLRKLFDPLVIEPDTDSVATTRLVDDGLGLAVPPCGGLGGRILRRAHRGERLFSSKDPIFVAALCQLLDSAEGRREAHERGAEEARKRIARDMHDDVGARLLTLIHRADKTELAEVARAAMADLRTALSALDTQPVPLGDALADWRAEASQRCSVAGVEMRWSEADSLPDRQLSAGQKAVLERALREGITNALKHAAANVIQVSVAYDDRGLNLSVSDDGRAPPPDQWREGRGLRGMRQRLGEVGGSLELAAHPEGGTRLLLSLGL